MLQMMKFLAEPPVQAWTLPKRFFAHTALWTLWLTGLQFAIMAVITLLRTKANLQQSARSPQLPVPRMLLDSTLGYISWAWLTGLLAAWLNPGSSSGFMWDYSCPDILVLLYFCLSTLMCYDAYNFFVHRWLHINKTAFMWFHAKHHEHQAALDVRSTGYVTAVEGLLSSGIPMAAIFAAGAATGNWWLAFAGVWHALQLAMVGHCGHELSSTSPLSIPVLLLNPMAYAYLGVPISVAPRDHEAHHTNPRCNFGSFFTYWDDRFGSSLEGRPPCSITLLAVHGLYQLNVLLTHYWVFSHLKSFVATWVLLYMLVTPEVAAAAATAMRIPEATRKLFGWFMDIYRHDNYITSPSDDSPGAFRTLRTTACLPSAAAAVMPAAPGAASLTATGSLLDPLVESARLRPAGSLDRCSSIASAAADDYGLGSDPAGSDLDTAEPTYLFACHPTGLLSRAAFLTFGARGWHSPVSHLPKVRMAVAPVLLQLPLIFMRELLLACGCIPAEWSCMKAALKAGVSVAVTPGGWREAQHLQTYNLVLARRHGFVALAMESGAQLVPVLCLGEQDLVGAAEPGFLILKWMISSRPHPIRVVFGEPLVPGTDESVAELHARYCKALLSLGKQHGVQLDIVE